MISGKKKALIDNFTKAFGEAFDSSIHKVTDIISEGELSIGGIGFVISKTSEAYDVEIPEINAVYTHMLGHDCHSIIAGVSHANAVIAQLHGYIGKGYDLILTSHYTPEDLKDAEVKIQYLEELKKIAAVCGKAEEFKSRVQEKFPEYSGDNYFEMTAGYFFG